MRKTLISTLLVWTITTPAINAQTQWSARAPMPTPQDYPASCVFNNQLYVFGGEYQAYGFLTAANESYDPVSNLWTHRAPLPQALAQSGAVAVQGFILVLGGGPQGPPHYSLDTVYS